MRRKPLCLLCAAALALLLSACGEKYPELGGGNAWYAFLNADGTKKAYTLSENLDTFRNSEGKTIGTAERSLNSLTHGFYVETKTDDDAGVDYTDKLAVYWASVSRLNTDYDYLTD